MIQWIRSLLFTILSYGAMPLVGLAFLPWALASPQGAAQAAQVWARWTLWLARWLVGIRTEVRGTPPTGQVMLAAKHQSFLDILMIYTSVPRARFIMKKELTRVPVFGQYALRLGCVPVDRGKRGQAIKAMLAEVAAGRDAPGQLVIYPQGTRVAPGVAAPYKIGTGALYQDLGQPAVPVACNCGLFWPRGGIMKRPGLAVIEYLPAIPPGLPVPDVMARLESAIEPASGRLMAEAGFRQA